ncbi:MAG TPA: sigma-54 dependent transcriptional regulator [Terriglobales bacterium]|jgi:DNA-binding NtrC family response regulator|nr:sigma-54 dependent transcriptional regulator [Terriglobales bacterium]
MNQVLVVDDEATMRAALAASFARNGWKVETAGGTSEAVAKFRRGLHPLVVTDIRMPDGDGFAVMREVRAMSPQTAVILLTAFGSVPDAVAAMKGGACDYLVKPVAFEELERAAQRILERAQALGPERTQLVGHSPALLRALERARQVAGTDADILIQAESGTGKELLARMVHRLSPRRDRSFVAVNCAAFPETLLESELFGHTKGAFTGALAAKAGKFELAHGGTLLLDEVGEMPLALQPKLLRVLQEREFDRLGDTRAVKVDIRVIATTNRPLEAMIREGCFRADLYYRLNVIPLSLPPLRERLDDIPELAEHFARLYAPSGASPKLLPEFLARLEQHPWPGNVRELANLMRRAVALSPGEIGLEVLEPSEIEATESGGERLRPGLSLESMERRLLEVTLDATAGNRSRAAEMLGVSLRTVRNKIRDYGLPARSSYVHD